MFRNKLDLPTAQDAFTAPGEKEIIEEYNEDEERKWRKEHHVKMRRHKQAEREEREKLLAGKDLDVNDLLDELELMEELDFELENLEIDSDEKLQKLISGEISVPSDTKRTAHATTIESNHPNVFAKPVLEEDNTASSKLLHTESSLNFDNNANEESSLEEDTSDSGSDENSTDEDLPEEFKAYRLEAEDMTSLAKQQFYRNKLHDIQSRLRTSKVNTFSDYVHKTDQMFLCDHLQSEIDRLQDAIHEKVDAKTLVEHKKADPKRSIPIKTQRSVSFGENKVTSFDKNQAPQQVSADLKIKSNDDHQSATNELSKHNEVQLTNEQLLEKDRVIDYVQKVASLNADEVTAAMNARYQEQVIVIALNFNPYCLKCNHFSKRGRKQRPSQSQFLRTKMPSKWKKGMRIKRQFLVIKNHWRSSIRFVICNNFD